MDITSRWAPEAVTARLENNFSTDGVNELTHYETVWKTLHDTSLAQGQGYDFNTFVFYVKHIFELCWEILQSIYPKKSDPQPSWYKTRPQDDVNNLKSLRDVQVKYHKLLNHWSVTAIYNIITYYNSTKLTTELRLFDGAFTPDSTQM